MWFIGVNISANCTSMWFFPLGCYIQQLRVFYLARFAELCDVIFNTYKINFLLFQCTILPTLPAVAMGVMEVGVLIAQHLLLLRQPQPECHTYFKSSHLSEENILCTVRQCFFYNFMVFVFCLWRLSSRMETLYFRGEENFSKVGILSYQSRDISSTEIP